MFERNSRLNPRKPIVGLLFAAITAVGSQAQTFTTLANFDTANGSGSSASLVQGFDGNFYGATLFGGINGLGTVFKMTPAGVITVLHTFDGASEPRKTAGRRIMVPSTKSPLREASRH
jgi:uncharacterized repeat protein (TIGR03803 family)